MGRPPRQDRNPAYRDVMYMEELAGSDTINTMPAVIIEAFEDRGHVSLTMEGQQRFEETRVTMKELSASAIGRK